MKRPYYTIRSEAAKDSAEILIYDVIGGYDFQTGKMLDGKQFAADLKALGDVGHIDLRLHTPGGDVFEGNAIFNALDRHPASITVYIDGLAASMGSIIAMVGDEIRIAENGIMMIHNPWTVAAGDANEMRRMAEFLDKVRVSAVRAYQRHSSLDEDEIIAAMDAETWYTAEEALAAGFVTAIDQPMTVAACAIPQAFGFSRMPAAAAHLVEQAHVYRQSPTVAATVSEPANCPAIHAPDTAGNSSNPNPKGHAMSIFDKLLKGLGFKPADGETDDQAEARLAELTAAIDDPEAVKLAFEAGLDLKGAYAQLAANLADLRAELDAAKATADAAVQTASDATARAEAAEAKVTEADAARAKLAAEVADNPVVVVTGEQNQGTPEEAWEASAELQGEFASKEAYAAWHKRHNKKVDQ